MACEPRTFHHYWFFDFNIFLIDSLNKNGHYSHTVDTTSSSFDTRCGGRGRKFKSYHSDQKRRFARVSFLFSTFQHRFFHSTPTFFAPVPILDVCFAYQVLFAIRRPHSPNLRNVSLRPHGQSQDCLFLSAFQHRFFTARQLFCSGANP